MTFSHQLNWLRYALSREFRCHHQPVPALHHMLVIPIEERVAILALLDAGNERAARRAIAAKNDDLRFDIETLAEGLKLYRTQVQVGINCRGAFIRTDMADGPDFSEIAYLPPHGVRYWSETYGNALEDQLRQYLWADAAVALIGEGVTPRVATLSLRDRLILYCLAVEGCSWRKTRSVMNAREFEVRQALNRGMRVMEVYESN